MGYAPAMSEIWSACAQTFVWGSCGEGMDTPDNSFTGACGWDAGTDSEMGYLMSVLRLDLSPQFFHFYASGVQAP